MKKEISSFSTSDRCPLSRLHPHNYVQQEFDKRVRFVLEMEAFETSYIRSPWNIWEKWCNNYNHLLTFKEPQDECVPDDPWAVDDDVDEETLNRWRNHDPWEDELPMELIRVVVSRCMRATSQPRRWRLVRPMVPSTLPMVDTRQRMVNDSKGTYLRIPQRILDVLCGHML
ncbi:hypothetical protein E3N88_18048 [Mikania micrantha]|uniref:Uncharacterized protein n=1 Tax=Mikania micrantha TaxID=192012 RepID=A0A5N6NTH8_9ASTR|nr:hypothetical protein E3N88_18048 [Mikania micrantha]